ncbi:Pycsar system effector family protein [Qipengyuania sp.]|uniref:Pycsar system effector family protein n=1 Tax=Qipengyuania sp. TaxID=2004515 RepID=UPI0035C86D12
MADANFAEKMMRAPSEGSEREFSPQAIHLMRTAQVNGLTHARMADQKASILLGATFLVFSLSITRALTGEVPVALTVLASFAFASSLGAVMAVLPTVSRPKGAVKNRNLLFFGHFAWMDEEEWTEELLTTLETDERVYRTMAHDLYQNGQVLQNKKFRYLSFAYRIFIAGLVVTLLVFAVEMVGGG